MRRTYLASSIAPLVLAPELPLVSVSTSGYQPDHYFKLTSAAPPISASFGGHNTMVDGMMSSAFAAAAAAHQDSLSRMTSMTNSIAPAQAHASHGSAGQILGE